MEKIVVIVKDDNTIDKNSLDKFNKTYELGISCAGHMGIVRV